MDLPQDLEETPLKQKKLEWGTGLAAAVSQILAAAVPHFCRF